MFEENIKMFLPAYLLIFFGIIFLWEIISKRKWPLENKLLNNIELSNIHNFKLVILLFKIIIILFFIVILLFCFFPYYYSFLIPIEVLNQSIIISIGFHFLKIVLVFLIFINVFMDKKTSSNLVDKKKLKIFFSSQDKLLIVLLIFIVCIFLIVPNILTSLLTSCGLMLFIYKTIKIKSVIVAGENV